MSATELVTYAQRNTSGDSFKCTRRTAAHLDSTKAALAKKHPKARLEIIQGCYNTGVAASAGTHDYDAVLDVRIVGLAWMDAQSFLRAQGWAAWWRHTGSWAATRKWHIHMVSLGYTGRVGVFVPGQVADYYRHAQGLKGQHDSGSDPTWHPADIGSTVFNYDAWRLATMPLNDADRAYIKRVAKEQADAAIRALRFTDPDDGAELNLDTAVVRGLRNEIKRAKP